LDLGLNFIDLAKTNDPITGGDLDWVARGILVYPQLEDALFALQPGSYSDIIETDIGFHILYAAERSTDHALTPQSRQILEHKILSDWVKEQKSSAEIIMLNK
ncbi:MAG TPA: peptidylprolyl isomerase, partial [Flexilinea sp.]|nr:peptidylprolyl isomerase [Flexilinea sp.]